MATMELACCWLESSKKVAARVDPNLGGGWRFIVRTVGPSTWPFATSRGLGERPMLRRLLAARPGD